MHDVELGHIVKGRHTTIATHLQHFLSFIGKDTKLKELERTDFTPIRPQPPLSNQQDERDKR